MLNRYLSTTLETLKKSILIIDLETSSHYPNGQEINIKSDFNNYIKFAKIKWFGAYSYKYNQKYLYNIQNNFKNILTLLREHTILCGFNFEEFDYPILINNRFIAKTNSYLLLDCMTILGKSSYDNRFKNRAELMEYKLNNNSLKCMAETFKLENVKSEIDYQIFNKNQWTELEIAEIKHYLTNDIMATKGLLDKLWTYWMPFTELLSYKHIYDLSWIKSSIASLTYKSACKVLKTEPTYADQTEKRKTEEMGGNVYLPKYEELNRVWYVDVGSLYPHMFCMGNLTAEINPNKILPYQKIWHGDDLFQVRGYYDITRWHPLAKYISEKLEERMKLKETDKDNPFIYTLKIFLNGLYGVMRSPIFEKVYTLNCGWDCCWLGQQVQALIKSKLEELGFEVIYGDTDSAMFVAKEGTDNSKENVQTCLNQITQIIKSHFPFPVDTFKINIEHYLDYLMFPFDKEPIVEADGSHKKINKRLVYERKGKKKNYLYIYTDKNGTKQVELIGLPIIKDNATALGIKIYEEVLKSEIIKNNRAKFSREFIIEKINEYLKKPNALKLISQSYKVNMASSYKNNCIQKQISEYYFKGLSGEIRLIKNTKIGNVGKQSKYCTIQEATNINLSTEDLDLEKVINELTPFIQYEEK